MRTKKPCPLSYDFTGTNANLAKNGKPLFAIVLSSLRPMPVEPKSPYKKPPAVQRTPKTKQALNIKAPVLYKPKQCVAHSLGW